MLLALWAVADDLRNSLLDADPVIFLRDMCRSLIDPAMRLSMYTPSDFIL